MDIMPTKIPAWYAKISILCILLFIETMYLSQMVGDYIQKQDYLNASTQFSISFIILLLITLVTYSLTIGIGNTWKQCVMIATPISFGITLSLFRYNWYYAVTSGVLVFALMCYDVHKTTKVKTLLIKFDPKFILRTSTKGLLFIFSFLGPLILVISNTTNPIATWNVGKNIADIMSDPLANLYNISYLDINIKEIVENQVNSVLEPYRNLFEPIAAILIFVAFRFLGSIAYYMYMILIVPIFSLAKRTGFIKYKKVMVEQEIPVF